MDFSLSKNIRQSWKELPTPLEAPEHCPFRVGGYLSFLLAFCYFSRIRFSKNRWVFSLFRSRVLARCPASPL